MHYISEYHIVDYFQNGLVQSNSNSKGLSFQESAADKMQLLWHQLICWRDADPSQTPVLMTEARRPVSWKRRETGKSDSQRVAERDRGSVHTALEAGQKQGLTGEPVRIDRPISSCQRELIWHQQNSYVNKEKGRPDPWVQTRVHAQQRTEQR